MATSRGPDNRRPPEAQVRGVATEELLAEISGRMALSPLERAEFHAKLAERHLREAEELLARGEHIQASEKAWGPPIS